jgi:predicted kinase
MYTKNNQTLSLEEAEANASAVGMELNDWASTFGWSSEGKQNDSTETDPPANQNTETSVGESNSGDISLGSPKPTRIGKYIYRGEEQTMLESDYIEKYAGEKGYPKTFEGFIKGWKGVIQETAVIPEVQVIGDATEETKDLRQKAKEYDELISNTNEAANKLEIALEYFNLEDLSGKGVYTPKVNREQYFPENSPKPGLYSGGNKSNWAKFKNDFETDLRLSLGDEKYNKWKELQKVSEGEVTQESIEKYYNDLSIDNATVNSVVNTKKVKQAEIFNRNLSEEEQDAIQRFRGDEDWQADAQEIYNARVNDELVYEQKTGRPLVSPQVVNGKKYVPSTYADYSVINKKQMSALNQESIDLEAKSEILILKFEELDEMRISYEKEISALTGTLKELENLDQTPENLSAYNKAAGRFNTIVESEAYQNFTTDWNNIIVGLNSYTDDITNFEEKYSKVVDSEIGLDAASKNYESIVRLAQVWEEFTLGSIAGGASAIYGIGAEWFGSEAFEVAKQGMVNYNLKLAKRREELLPQNLTLADIGEGATRSQWVGEALINNSPSIVVAMLPMGAAGLAAKGAARISAMKRAAKATSLFFGVAEGGGYMAGTDVAVSKAENNIKSLRLELAGAQGETDKQEIRDAIEYQQSYLNLSETQKAFNGVAYGTIATYAERLGTLGFLSNIQKYSRAVGYNTFLKVMSQPLAKAFSKTAGAVKAGAIGVGIEEIEETVTLLGQNFMDITVGQQNKSMLEGLDADFFANVAVSSFAMSGPTMGSNIYNAVVSEFKSSKQIDANRKNSEKLFNIIEKLDSDKLTKDQRIELRKQRKSVLEELAISDSKSLFNIKGLSTSDIENVAELNRQLRQIKTEASALGYGDVTPQTRKELNELLSKYRELTSTREEILNKPQEEIKKLAEEAQNSVEADFNLNNYAFNIEVAKAFGKDVNVISGFEVQDGKFDPNVTNILRQAIEDSRNGLEVNGKIYIFEDIIKSRIIQNGGFDAKFAAVAPLHEVGHQQSRALGIIIADKNSDAKTTKFVGDANAMIDSVVNEVTSLYQAGRISKKDYEAFTQRVEAYENLGMGLNQYSDTGFLDPDELLQIVADMTNMGILPKSSFGKLHEIKAFINSMLNFAGIDPVYFKLKNASDVSDFVASWSTQLKQGGKLQLPPDEESQKASISNEAEKAKQVLEKVSADMALFDPNSPLVAKIAMGMVRAQLSSYMNKGLKIDIEEAVSEVITRIYSANDIGKYNGTGTLYGYLNGRIKYRILDAFKNNNAIVEDFSTSDLDDVKGVAAVEMSVASTEERTESEKPEYRPLLNSRIATPELIGDIVVKIPRIVGTLKSRIDAPVSKNTTVTPLVNELRLALGKQLDIDLKKAMGGKKDGVLRRFLTDNKKAVLENMTTTYLMSAFPAAVQKKVDGVWTSDWKGKKIDRETTSTDKAGRTSGAELVRRLPNASTKIDDKTFLSFILDEKGNPLRGKKESLAKAIAEELAIEIINQEMQDADSKIRQAFEANQERLGVEVAVNHIQQLALQLERGNIKFSIGLNIIKDKDFQNSAVEATRFIQGRLKEGRTISELIDQDGKFIFFGNPVGYILKIKENAIYTEKDVSSFMLHLFENGLIPLKPIAKFAEKWKKSSVLRAWFKERGYDTPRTMLRNSSTQNDKNQYAGDMTMLGIGLGKQIIDLMGAEFLGFASYKVLPLQVIKGKRGAVRTQWADQMEILMQKVTDVPLSDLPKNLDLNKVEIFQPGKGVLQEVDIILNNKNLSRKEKIAKLNEESFNDKGEKQESIIARIREANKHNKILAKHIATIAVMFAKQDVISPVSLGYLFQQQSPIIEGLRGLVALEFITVTENELGKVYLEHVDINSSAMFDIFNSVTLESDTETVAAISKAIDNNRGWVESSSVVKLIDTTTNPVNPSGTKRLLASGNNMENILHISGIPAQEILQKEIEAKEATESLGIDFSKLEESKEVVQLAFKLSIGAPQVIFMVGGPGSGKSSIINGTGLIKNGFKLVNQDISLEQMKILENLPADEKTYDKEQRSLRAKLGWKARKIAEEKMNKYMGRRDNAIIDGTGASFNATRKKMAAFENAGYTVHAIFVNTSKDVALDRNKLRAERSLPDFIVAKTWDSVQESAAKYKEEFGERVYEINADKLSYNNPLPKEFLDKINTGLDNVISKYSIGLSLELNKMIERTKGVPAEKVYSKAQARMQGEQKGKYRVFVPASAEDFRGLTAYTFAGKGKQGEADQKFIEDNLITPYTRGVAMIDAVKQQIRREYKALAKAHKQPFKMLGKKVDNSDYTYDQALRVYIWTQQGIEIPGMDRDDINFLVNAINQFPGLIEIGNAMQIISRQDTWMEPGEHWLSRTLISDLNGMTEKVGRKKFLQEFIENSEVIFSKENLNKIEAVYGTRHKEALKDALYAMTNGTNRVKGSDNAQVNAWQNWVNNSTGAIMFFNRRSAILQTLSATNFINWSDNNPLKVAAAFANQPQYWSDFAMIFNSDKLKERRSGLQTDVNQAEIANEAKGAKNKAGAVIAYLLKIGFTPTQIADSFAIAAGGSSFYRNRVNTYLKEGMEQEAAEKQAFEDFSKTADEAQQSSDPYLVSQEQRSPLGRLVLAFQNTPMQYTRLMKKSMQDLANRRGDPKTHISKIIYYGAVQNFIFSALQSALFAVIPGFDDEDESEMTEKELEKLERKNDQRTLRIINSMTDSVLKGSGVKGAAIATLKNTITEYFKQEEKGFTADHTYTILQALSLSPPIGSKARKLYSAIQTKKFERDTLAARGFDVTADGKLNLSPAYSIIGSLASALGNVPLDRVVDELNSIVESLDSRNTTWQRIALALGWKTWDVGASNEEHDLIKTEAKEQRKKEGKAKAKETRVKNKENKIARKKEDWAEFSKGMSGIEKGSKFKAWSIAWDSKNKNK